MDENDLAFLRHMSDAAREATSFSKGKIFEDMIQNRVLLLALVKELEIIGEAASRMSPEGRASIGGIPWGRLMEMRSRLTQEYFDWPTESIWNIVISDLPDLFRASEAALDSLR